MQMRKSLLLGLIYADQQSPVEGRTRLQKMLFIFQQEIEDKLNLDLADGYQFQAYDYGPFAPDLYQDLEELVSRGLVVEEKEEFDDRVKYNYKITKDGKKIVEDQIESKEEFDEFLTEAELLKSQFNNLSLQELIDKVYSKYPQFARNSKWQGS